jgi:hypothetical protein
VMWLDIGVDSGPILTTARPRLSGTESLSELHWNVMQHAHDLCVQAVSAFVSGRQVPCVPQDKIAPGRTYYSAEWNGLAMLRAWRNFPRSSASGEAATAPSATRICITGSYPSTLLRLIE